MDKGFDTVKDWLTKVLEPYFKEAVDVIKEEHLLTRRSPPPNGDGPFEDGEVPNDFPRATSPGSDNGSTVDPGTLSYFNQWCQQKGKKVDWKFTDAHGTKATPLWKVEAWMGNEKVGEGLATGKKSAKVFAAKKAMDKLGIVVGTCIQTPLLYMCCSLTLALGA